MIPTPATFRRRDFSRSIFASQQFSDFVDQGKARCRQPAQLGWVLTQRNGDFRWTNPRLGWIWPWTNVNQCRDRFSSEQQQSLTTWQRPMTLFYILRHTTTLFVDESWQNWRSDPGEIEIYNTPLLSRQLQCLRPRLSRQGWREAGRQLCKKPWIQGSRTFLGFGPRICTSGAPRS